MADVARTRGAASGSLRERREEGERGQIMLVTALSLAILFVALALILNTAIYTENLATRSSDIGGGTDAVRFHDAARDGVGGVIEYANYHNNSSYFGDLLPALGDGVDDYQAASARQFALGDRAVEVRLLSPENGTRIGQNDDSQKFTNASGTANWTVATGVSDTRAFRMNVPSGELVELASTPFVVVFDNGTDEWRLTVSSPVASTDVEVTVDGPTVSGSCITSGPAWINVSAGTLDGDSCAVLRSYADELSGPYEIRFRNGDFADGTYTLVVDNGTLADNPDPHLNSPGSGQPFATTAVYSATVDIYYETPRLYYKSTVRVAPGEPE